MRKITILLIMLIVLFGSVSVNAVDGYVSFNLDNNTDGEYELYLCKEINNFEIGGKFTTHLMSFVSDNEYFPKGRPSYQTYDLIIKYDINDRITLNFISGIKQYFAQRWYNTNFDESYSKIGIKYEFK